MLRFENIVENIRRNATPSQLNLLRQIVNDKNANVLPSLRAEDQLDAATKSDLQRLHQIGLLEASSEDLDLFAPTILASRILNEAALSACRPTDLLSTHSRERFLAECLSRAITLGNFPLNQPGPEARYYFDFDNFISMPGWHRTTLLRLLVIMVQQIFEISGIDALACRIPTSGLLGTYPILFALSERFKIPFSIKWTGRQFWKGRSLIGWMPTSSVKRCVVIHDVTSSGISVADLVAELTQLGADVLSIISVFDREEGATSYLASQNCEDISLVSLSEIQSSIDTSSTWIPNLLSGQIEKFRDAFGQRTQTIDMGNDHISGTDVSLLQIASNFHTGEHQFNKKEGDQQKNTIRELVNEALASGSTQVLVFPELSVPYQALGYLQQVAKQRKIWIFAGMEYDYSKRNKCQIIAPDGRTIAQLKLTQSPYDDPKMVPGYQQLLFKRTGIGDFAAIICIDLLQSRLIADLRNRLDVLFILSYNTATTLFIEKAKALSIELHCFVVLVNVANFGSSVVCAPTKGEGKLLLRMPSKTQAVGKVHLDIPQIRDPSNQLYYARLRKE